MALRTELIKLQNLKMREKTAASLVAGIQHCAFKTNLAEFSEEREIRLFVSEHHAHEGHVARKLAQRIAETVERRPTDGELDAIDAIAASARAASSKASST
jgi:hypothetical protein